MFKAIGALFALFILIPLLLAFGAVMLPLIVLGLSLLGVLWTIGSGIKFLSEHPLIWAIGLLILLLVIIF